MSATVITKPETIIAPDLLRKFKAQVEEQGQVVLHFLLDNYGMSDTLIRIWPTTYLYDQLSPHKSELVHAENITFFPHWTAYPPGQQAYFTLIFTGLPKSCTMFDFIEHCDNQIGAFKVLNIKRNKSDVYYLKI